MITFEQDESGRWPSLVFNGLNLLDIFPELEQLKLPVLLFPTTDLKIAIKRVIPRLHEILLTIFSSFF